MQLRWNLYLAHFAGNMSQKKKFWTPWHHTAIVAKGGGRSFNKILGAGCGSSHLLKQRTCWTECTHNRASPNSLTVAAAATSGSVASRSREAGHLTPEETRSAPPSSPDTDRGHQTSHRQSKSSQLTQRKMNKHRRAQLNSAEASRKTCVRSLEGGQAVIKARGNGRLWILPGSSVIGHRQPGTSLEGHHEVATATTGLDRRN